MERGVSCWVVSSAAGEVGIGGWSLCLCDGGRKEPCLCRGRGEGLLDVGADVELLCWI